MKRLFDANVYHYNFFDIAKNNGLCLILINYNHTWARKEIEVEGGPRRFGKVKS